MKVVCALLAVAALAVAAAAADCATLSGADLLFGGTFVLHNHPNAEMTRPGLGYGLRVDGLFDGDATHRVVFDFNRVDKGADMRLQYIPTRNQVIISGTAWGGQLSGDVAACNAVKYNGAPESQCTFINPQLYQITYYLNHVKKGSGSVPSLSSRWGEAKDADGNTIAYPDDYGFVQPVGVSTTSYPIRASQMAPVAWFVNLGSYRNFWATYSGYGWVEAPNNPVFNPDVVHYRDWSFILCSPEGNLPPPTGGSGGNCSALANDRFANWGGTYRIRNHPKADFTDLSVRPNFGYGLRLDGLFSYTAGERVFFDFNRDDMGAAMYLHFNKATGLVHIFGTAYGGLSSGDSTACNSVILDGKDASVCSFVEPRLWAIDFTYNYVQRDCSGGDCSADSFSSWVFNGDGGSLYTVDNGTPHSFNLKPAEMEGHAFFVVKSWRGYTDSYTAYGWALVNDLPPVAPGEYRDFGFILQECDCQGLHSLIPAGGTFFAKNKRGLDYGLYLGDAAAPKADDLQFDFNAGDALGGYTYVEYSRALSSLRVIGVVKGGVTADKNRLWNLTFTYPTVAEDQFRTTISSTGAGAYGSLQSGADTITLTAGAFQLAVTGGIEWVGTGVISGAGKTGAWSFRVGAGNCPVPCPLNCDAVNRLQCAVNGVCGACKNTFFEAVAGDVACSASCAGALPAYCAARNRHNCSATSNTCGVCLRGYVGVAGDSNVACTVLAANAAALLSVDVGNVDGTNLPAGWVADSNPIGGAVEISSDAVVSGVADPAIAAIYQTNRFWPGLSTTVPAPVYNLVLANDAVLAGGTFLLRMHFVNFYSATASVGARVYDIYVNDALVVANFDVIAAAGATQVAWFEDVLIAIKPQTQNFIRVSFVARREAPQLAGIQVFSA